MKLTVLIENTTRDPALRAEHGLSLYLEIGGKRYLFDTGATGAFVDNALRLGLDLSLVDGVILSHGHYDHGGGMEAFFACNATAPVYLHEEAFGEHYNGAGGYIGLPRHLRSHPRLIPVSDRLTLASGVTLECCCDRKPKYTPEPYGMYVVKNGELFPEAFCHELYLVVEEEKRICFSGCAHRGVENIVHWLRPEVLVGGFHFKPLQPGDRRLTVAAQRLLESPCTYYTCHCTGVEQYAFLKQQMGDRLHYLSTGDVIAL